MIYRLLLMIRRLLLQSDTFVLFLDYFDIFEVYLAVGSHQFQLFHCHVDFSSLLVIFLFASFFLFFHLSYFFNLIHFLLQYFRSVLLDILIKLLLLFPLVVFYLLDLNFDFHLLLLLVKHFILCCGDKSALRTEHILSKERFLLFGLVFVEASESKLCLQVSHIQIFDNNQFLYQPIQIHPILSITQTTNCHIIKNKTAFFVSGNNRWYVPCSLQVAQTLRQQLFLKMRNKGRFEYVDQMRKISTIEKMGVIDSLYPVDFQEEKVDNNKFIRYKQEVILEQPPKKQNYLFTNPIVTSYKQDIEPECNQKFNNNIDSISTDIDYYKNWSDNLNVQIKKRDYEHRFYFQNAQPPPRLKQEGKDKNKKDDDLAGQGKLKTKQDKQGNETAEQDTNLDLPQRQKYNFSQITKNLHMNKFDKDDLEGNRLANAGIKNEIIELRKLKNLQQIQKLGGFQQEFNKFNYYIEIPEERYEIDFIENSVVRGNNNLAIDYFRDIGMPSRDIAKYTIKNYNKMKAKDEEDEPIQNDSIYNQEKRELLYLYFLKQHELKINKNDINFSDVANFSMGRITSMNAHMCVRNEKVTKAQYMKLLKKMEKYDMRQNEGGKTKNDKEVGTQDLQDMLLPTKGEQQVEQKLDNIDIQKIIEQINSIKRDVRLFEQTNNTCKVNKQNFYNEVYNKVEAMLNILYSEVVDKLGIKYPLSQIRSHIHQIQGSNQLGYERVRLLWYIASCYDEMLSKQAKKVDLRSMADTKLRQTPIITKYKGKKMIGEDNSQTKKLFGFNNTEKSKSPLQKTPIKPTKDLTPTKSTKGQASLTPTKQRMTEKKKQINNTTISSKKWPTTAKK